MHVLSIVAPGPDGPPKRGIIGAVEVLDDGHVNVASFRPNPEFVELVHDVVRTHGPGDPALLAEAERLGNGRVYVVDRRASGTEDAPPEDIVGFFEVSGGKIEASSYRANELYRLLTDSGLVCLPPSLHEVLIRVADSPSD